ncbi:hypothetical protein [Pseudomonas syringae]|uniref:hypothetical protein n=1 Tax=Pseudomonas syringae TaxID=317 RepID=UPI0018E6426E|nr:hypothetical protein [Pseudomonas syringae]MBI6794939.1 hypothetical protein [Pseudomonas syringae]
MGSYTNFMTGVVCHIVKKIPSLFSVRMRLASEGYFRSLDEIRNSTDVQSSECIAQYSLLFPHYDWTFTGIRHLQPLSMSDAVKAIRWGENNSIWKKNRIEINPTDSREVSLDRLFFQDTIDGQKIPENRRINANSQWVTHCFLSVVELKGGYYFLSTHWYLTDVAATLLQRVSVEDIPLRSINYETCNPFRYNFSAATLPGRLNKSEDRIVSNMDKLHQEITRLEKLVRARLSIKKKHEGVYTLDAYNNSDRTYFDLDLDLDLPHAFRGNAAADRHVIDTSVSSASLILGEKGDKEFLITSNTLKRAKIPYLAIYSVPAVDEQGNRKHIPRDKVFASVENSVHIFQLLFLLRRKFDETVKVYSKVIVSGLNSPGKSYSRLYDASIELMESVRIAEILESDESLYKCKVGDKPAARMRDLVVRHLKDFKSMNEDVALIKQICSEKVSAENLVYQRRMTYLVVFLAALQVVIAAASMSELKVGLGAFWRALTM